MAGHPRKLHSLRQAPTRLRNSFSTQFSHSSLLKIYSKSKRNSLSKVL